jgi:dephospho-CoA kinase
VKRPFCIGLTGGIGSGKSCATDVFSEFGVPVIDADSISHELVQPGQSALQAIVKSFGVEVLNSEGRLRRDYLRQVIFDDPESRKKLEAIIHPLVFKEITRRLDLVDFPYCVLSSPLLLESRSAYKVDRILVIDAPEELQVERASLRDKSKQAEIRKIIKAQASRQQRLAMADDVIVNDKDLSFLKEQLETLHKKYMKMAAEKTVTC